MAKQLPLLIPVIHEDIKGLEMGILESGVPYLSGRGLAKLCGVAPGVIHTWTPVYDPNTITGRDATLRDLLRKYDYHEPTLYVQVELGGKRTNAFPADVCNAVLEYYAFESRGDTTEAMKNFRSLARGGLRTFIYQSLGYDASGAPSGWVDFQQRLTLNKLSPGLFSAFSEMHKLVLLAIQGGLVVNHKTIPDISIGRVWSGHWTKEKLAETYGEREKYEHTYPDSYPQSAQNPYDAYAYPIAALGEFHTWFQGTYVPQYFPKYVRDKVKDGAIKPAQAAALITTVRTNLMIGSGTK